MRQPSRFDADYWEEEGKRRREDRLDDLGRCEASLEWYRERHEKLKELCKQMWAGINTIREDGVYYVAMAMPEYYRKMKELGLLEEEEK